MTESRYGLSDNDFAFVHAGGVIVATNRPHGIDRIQMSNVVNGPEREADDLYVPTHCEGECTVCDEQLGARA